MWIFLRNKIKYRLYLNGINPYHSFLHNNHRNQESLVFDFAEFWIAYVDKLIFYSLEKGIIKEKDMYTIIRNDSIINDFLDCLQIMDDDVEIDED